MFQCMCIFIYTYIMVPIHSYNHICTAHVLAIRSDQSRHSFRAVQSISLFVRGAVRRAKHPSLGAEDLDGQRVTWQTRQT